VFGAAIEQPPQPRRGGSQPVNRALYHRRLAGDHACDFSSDFRLANVVTDHEIAGAKNCGINIDGGGRGRVVRSHLAFIQG
jgi:hypothetical protein